MKKKTIVSSVLSIAMCSCLAIGGTYALFTSESKVNIAVTSGKVDVDATAEGLKTYSVAYSESGTVIDENGATYAYVEQSGGAFANGGRATLEDGNVITLDRITPGDKVTFNINVANNSNVAVQYRVKLLCEEGEWLCSVLDFQVTKENVTEDFSAVYEYISTWTLLPAQGEISTVNVEIALPISVGNFYQNRSATFYYIVEAVQGNAATTDESVKKKIVADNSQDLAQAIADGQNVILTAPVQLPEVLQVSGDVTIYGVDENSTLICPDGQDRVININENSESVTLTLAGINVQGPTTGTYTRGISLYGNSDVTLVVDNCSVSASYYALNVASENDNVNVVIKNTEIEGWAAFQTWSAGTKATFENCILKGNNDKGYNGIGWNDFATIVINTDAANSEVTFKNCRIEANQTTGNKQDLFSIRTTGVKVTVENSTFWANGSEIADSDLGNYLTFYTADPIFTIDGVDIAAVIAGETTYAVVDEEQDLIAALSGNKEQIFVCGDIELTQSITVSRNVLIQGFGAGIYEKPVNIQPDVDVTIKNILFESVKADDNKASFIYGDKFAGKLVIENCKFTDTQWDALQILPVDGAEIVIRNNTFNVTSELVSTLNGKSNRYIHIECTGADMNATVTVEISGNTFNNMNKIYNSLIDIDYVNENSVIKAGKNTFNGYTVTASNLANVVYLCYNNSASQKMTMDKFNKFVGETVQTL